MKALPPADRFVPWLYVEYDLGALPNGTTISARVANPFDAAAEIWLHHDPEKGEAWREDKPRVSVRIQPGEENGADGRLVARLDGGQLDSVNTFRLTNRGGPEQGRETGQFTVWIENEKFAVTIPSSLFKYVHGANDPYTDRLLSRGHGLFEQLLSHSDYREIDSLGKRCA